MVLVGLFIFWGILHGLALMIHRAWKSFGLTMNKYIAWLITFNFVNIAWIFFRAKDWDSAMKVLIGMFAIGEIRLPAQFISIFKTFSIYGIKFGNCLQHIQCNQETIVYIVLGFIITLLFKNSNQILIAKQKPNLLVVIVVYMIFSFSILKSLLSNTTVFLYFNF